MISVVTLVLAWLGVSSATTQNLATKTVTFALYSGYKIDSRVLTSSSQLLVSTTTKELCAFTCLNHVNCFAAMFKGSSTCALFRRCGHVTLTLNQDASKSYFTYVFSNLSAPTMKPDIDLPLLYYCGGFAELSNSNFDLDIQIINQDGTQFLSRQESPNGIRYALEFVNASNYPLDLTSFVQLRDNSTFSLDLFSTVSDYSISFAVFFTDFSLRSQAILSFQPDLNSRACFYVSLQQAASSALMVFAYSSGCQGSSGIDWTMSVKVSNYTWYHTTFVFDSQALTAACYVNGLLNSWIVLPSLNVATQPVTFLLLGSGNDRDYSMKGSVVCFQLYHELLTSDVAESLHQLCFYGGLVFN